MPNPRLRGAHRIAIAHHCRLGFETIHPRFRSVDGAYSVILTVNTGYE
jgi:hypothetical protein